jgi:hypothetical protein
MPATRITIALNAKQSQKAPLLTPASASLDPVSASSIRALVLKTAQSKLRLKKPTRIFVGRTGHELLTEEDWKRNIRDDVVLLISAGEEFVGVKRESGVHGKLMLLISLSEQVCARLVCALNPIMVRYRVLLANSHI